MPDVTTADDDYSEMRLIDLRAEIHQRIGVTGMPGNSLTKPALNSLVAYLTGDLPEVPSELFKDGGKNKPGLKKTVAQEVKLLGFLDGDMERQFRKAELVEILETMDKRGDCRVWAGEPTEIGDRGEQ